MPTYKGVSEEQWIQVEAPLEAEEGRAEEVEAAHIEGVRHELVIALLDPDEQVGWLGLTTTKGLKMLRELLAVALQKGRVVEELLVSIVGLQLSPKATKAEIERVESVREGLLKVLEKNRVPESSIDITHLGERRNDITYEVTVNPLAPRILVGMNKEGGKKDSPTITIDPQKSCLKEEREQAAPDDEGVDAEGFFDDEGSDQGGFPDETDKDGRENSDPARPDGWHEDQKGPHGMVA